MGLEDAQTHGACVDVPLELCAEGNGSGPFVIYCADYPQGLSVLEQVDWARNTKHPMMDFPTVDAEDDRWRAIGFETDSAIREIDSWREKVMEKYRLLA